MQTNHDTIIDAITSDPRFNWDHFGKWRKKHPNLMILDYAESLFQK